MKPKCRLYCRSRRANGTYYAEDRVTGVRESLETKIRSEALKLLQAKNESYAQPILSAGSAGPRASSERLSLRYFKNRCLKFPKRDCRVVKIPPSIDKCISSLSLSAVRNVGQAAFEYYTRSKRLKTSLVGLKDFSVD